MLELQAQPDKAYGDGTFIDTDGEVYRATFIDNKAYVRVSANLSFRIKISGPS